MEENDKKTVTLASEMVKNNMEPQIVASLTSQTNQNTDPASNNHNNADICPVHDAELTDGFCEFCQICYSCK